MTIQGLPTFINATLLLNTDDTCNIIYHHVAKSAIVLYLQLLKLQKN